MCRARRGRDFWSRSGPNAGTALAFAPTAPEYAIPPHLFSRCCAHARVARICREGGARVRFQCLFEGDEGASRTLPRACHGLAEHGWQWRSRHAVCCQEQESLEERLHEAVWDLPHETSKLGQLEAPRKQRDVSEGRGLRLLLKAWLQRAMKTEHYDCATQ